MSVPIGPWVYDASWERYTPPVARPPRTPSLLEVAGHIPAPEINQYVPPNLFDLLGIKTTYTTTGPSAAVTAAQPSGGGFDPIGFVVKHPFATFAVGSVIILLLVPKGRR